MIILKSKEIPLMIKKINTALLISALCLCSVLQSHAAAPVCPLQGTPTQVKATDLVKNPDAYLNKNVKITGIFDKFVTIGLDYKPAFRDSKDYISFLIRKDEIQGHIIPMSELKILISRKTAEKQLAKIESGDKIEIEGKMFSAALGDPWIEACKVTIIAKKEKKDDKVKTGAACKINP